MRSTLKALVLAGACVLLAACARDTRPPQDQAAVPALPAADVSGATVYAVDAAASNVAILVYRGGTLARLGHNHVMTSQSVQGSLWLHPALARSGFELSFPVDELVVDDPAGRRAAGSEFPPEIPQADRDGTRRNMLRAEVLDGANYPTVKLRSVSLTGTQQAPSIITRITIKQISRDVTVPATVRIEGSRVTASGEFDIEQSAFGITPFSIGLGALTVQDRLRVKFRIVAVR